MKKHFFLLALLFFHFILSGCVSSFSKIRLENVKFVKLMSVSLTSSEIMLSFDFDNRMGKELTVVDAQVISDDIENLMISLNTPVCLLQGKSTIETPMAINYSLGSALTLLGLLQNGVNTEYSFLINIKYSKGNSEKIKKISFKKKFSKEELYFLVTKLSK